MDAAASVRPWGGGNGQGWDQEGAPSITSPHATGSLRYIDAQPHGDDILFLYELTRPNGAHEMRMAKFPSKGFTLK